MQFIVGASRPAGFLAAGFRRGGAGRFVDDGFGGALAAGFLAAGFFAAGFRCDGGAFRFFVEAGAGADAGASLGGRRGGSCSGGGGGGLAAARAFRRAHGVVVSAFFFVISASIIFLRMAPAFPPLPYVPCDEVLAEQHTARKAEYAKVREQVLSMAPPTSLRIGDSVSAAFDQYMLWEGTVSKAATRA